MQSDFLFHAGMEAIEEAQQRADMVRAQTSLR